MRERPRRLDARRAAEVARATASIRRAHEARRRVHIARVLVFGPGGILAERPTAARSRHRRVDRHEIRGRLALLDPGVERGEPIPARLERTVAVAETRHDVETR